MKHLSAIRRVLTNPRIVAAEAAFCTYTVVLHAAWVGLVLFAYEQGGIAEAGIVSFGVLLPASLLGPFVAAWFSRLQPNRSLTGGLVLQALTVAIAAAALSAGLSAGWVYVSLGVFATAQMTTRPSISANLPRIVKDPAELAAANSTTELIETLGLLVGPALAGFVLLVGDVQGLFVASAITLGCGALAGLGLGRGDEFGDDIIRVSVAAEVRSGARQLSDRLAVRHLVIVLLAVKLIIGTLEVALVPIALDQLGRGEASIGLLGAALGFGGMAGAAMSFLLVGRRRLTPVTLVAVLVSSMPLVALAATSSTAAVVILLAIAGAGRPIVAVGGRTLLQSLSSEDTLAQLFGFLEGVSMLAVAVGSLGFALAAQVMGLQAALVLAGLLPAAISLWLYRPLSRIDRGRPIVDAELLALVRQSPIFAPLSAFRLEQLLANMGSTSARASSSIFVKGDWGDCFYLVDQGSAVVELDDGEVGLGRGEFFGEIALLHNAPRMASVRSGPSGLRAYTLDGAVFLEALSSVPTSRRRAERIVDARLNA